MPSISGLRRHKEGVTKKIGYWEVVSIGVGGMVGGGIFAVLGVAVQLAHGGAPVAFGLAGIVALLTTYSYVKLSLAYPNRGGTVAFLNRVFGSGQLTGSINILLWLSYVVMLALYAYAFGSYGSTFLSTPLQTIGKYVLVNASLVAIMVLNLFSADVIGKAEDWIVGTKVLILLAFIVVGIRGIHGAQLAPSAWSPPLPLLAGGMIIFLAYEGFELIANTAQDVRNVQTVLPRAYYSAVGFVIVLYILVGAITVGSLPVGKIIEAKDYALAEAARPFMGHFGFIMIAVAAMLSTASAINATLYGAARLTYAIAKDGELPVQLEKKVWGEPVEGLLITVGLTLVVVNVFDLVSISTMGSAGFLLVFAAVNAANVVHAGRTGSARWISAMGFIACVAALGALLRQTFHTSPAEIWVLVSMVVLAVAIEGSYRWLTKRRIRVS